MARTGPVPKKSIDETLSRRGVSVLVIGLSGNGKTSSCRKLSPDHTLFVTPDIQGIRVLKQWGWTEGRFEAPRTPEDYAWLINHFAMHDDYQTLVIDTLNIYVEELIKRYERENEVKPEANDWGRFRYASALTHDLVNRALDAVACGKDLVVLCHQKAPLKKDEPLVPDLFGQLPEQIARKFDIICHAASLQNPGEPVRYFFELPAGENYKKDLYGISWPRPNDVERVIVDAKARTPSHETTPTPPAAPSAQPRKRRKSPQKEGEAAPSPSPTPAAMSDEVKDLAESVLERCESLGKSRGWGLDLLQQIARTKDFSKLTIEHISRANDHLDNLGNGRKRRQPPTHDLETSS